MIKFLQSKKTIAAITLVALMTANYVSFTYSSGPPAQYTNAPSEGNCTSCHSGSAQSSGSTYNKVKLAFNTGTLEYLPDSTYTVSISVSHGSFNKFGFETTVLDKNNKFVGTLTAGSSGNYKQNSGSRDYIQHNSSGTSGSSNAKTWTFTWKAPSSNVGDICFYMSVMCSNNNSSDNGDSVFTKKICITPSSKLPTASFNVNKSSLCVGDTLFCTDNSTNNPTGWNWTVSPTSGVSPSSSTQQNPSFVFSKAATYKVKLVATNNKGKSQPDSTNIVVFAPPTISISSPKTAICQGNYVTLTASYTSGSIITWSNGGTGDTITVNTAGTYTCTAVNSSNCSATSNSIKISINPTPQVSLSQTTSGNSFCSKDSITFQATTGLSSYNFMVNGTSVQNSSSDTYKLTGMSGSLDLTVVADSNGCSSNASNTVNVNVTPQLAAPSANCQAVSSNSITWAWNSVTGATGYEVSEDGGTNWGAPSSGSNGTTHTKSGLNSGQSYTILIRAKDNAPCNLGKIATISCFTGTCTATTYQVTNNSTACEGKSDTIKVSPTNASKFGIVYNGGAATSSTQFIYTVANGANVIPVEIFDSAQLGCPTAKFNVTVNSYKPSTPTLTPDKTKVCMPKDAPVKYTVTPAGGASYMLYDSVGNLVNTINSGNSYQSSDETELVKLNKATQLDAAGCESNFSTGVKVQVVTDPKLTLTSTLLDAGHTYSFKQSNIGGYPAGWTYGDGGIGSGDSVSHAYTKNGIVVVEVSITKDGCKYKVSDSLTIMKVSVPNLEENTKIYPNPFSNELILQLENPAKRLLMFDAQGRVVIQMSENELNGKYFISLATSTLPFGVYLLQTETQNGVISRRLVKVSE